ncbi:1-(5-phosphoribosyl)-5-[(5-phosphoribosylamino)methylideneamino] imidazole-4-carboxamide isomerase [Natrialba hulunbeirensis JCM 10989]|uniref:1-(5-phosphoribosyl)-5-[(5-phosphoribosylamino)methylideneamino] imidazole-4-carboxamide isomerase n=1 Tax=Natrialba hulunbeirensis JCM 10989 TaxID=1227493 RepID=L9ZXM4_9EURY|nr:1-(5-phosphoribosyl)-5-[(5-phosphoribosylamino)methylideneamino]imidazole-4-carboxamide isomerase [Natrialba hulunbeirensis]ELY91260.1 1-(5-phosphoribosyl)-5-[(5-phosphoribosylamino)methylideneamino] imidazole-4-carboxamide isomerase [Natrialba hulunbeirensis JCM 10989]
MTDTDDSSSHTDSSDPTDPTNPTTLTNPATFDIIPAVDIQNGEVVQLVQGERGTEKTYGDPVDAAQRWLEAGADSLHLVDLDGAFDGERENAAAIESVLESVDVPTQLGGGIRTAADARDVLDRGVDRVILGTAAVEDPDIVAEISETHPDSVIVSLDAKDGEVVVEGWTEGAGVSPVEAAERYEELGAAAILFTNVDVEGQLEGVATEPVRELVETTDVPVIASGGVATLADIRALEEAGAAAAVVGSALYEGNFTLEEAKAVVGDDGDDSHDK